VQDEPPAVNGGGWPTDPEMAGALREVLVAEVTARGWPLPEDPAEQATVLWAARLCLRRRLLVAEGIDPRTGLPAA
jgi:hypothetical protein